MRVQIQNWKKVQGRTDVERPKWFAFPRDLFTDPEYHGELTANAVAAYAYASAMALGTKDGIIEVRPKHLKSSFGMDLDQFERSCELLEKLQLVHILVRDADGSVQVRTEMCPTLHNTTLQDTTPPEPPAPDVEADSRTYDHDHPSVTVPAEERPLPQLALLWNQHAAEVLPRVKLCSASRRKHAANRWKEHPSEEFWTEVIWRINASDFCLGKLAKERPWKADFDWLCRPDTAARVLEGRYDNRGPGGSTPPQKSFWARQVEAQK